MASTTDPEAVKGATPPPPQPQAPPCRGGCSWADVTLRVLLFAASLVALVVMVTSEETKTVMVPPGLAPPGAPTMMRREAKFNHSPAFIYFVAAFAVTCLYSIITTIASASVMLKPTFSSKFLLYSAIMDILMLGVVASATGTAGGVAYVGLKGNSHVGWGKVCNVYDKYCKHVASSLAMALFSSVLLVLLSIISACSLSKMIRD